MTVRQEPHPPHKTTLQNRGHEKKNKRKAKNQTKMMVKKKRPNHLEFSRCEITKLPGDTDNEDIINEVSSSIKKGNDSTLNKGSACAFHL